MVQPPKAVVTVLWSTNSRLQLKQYLDFARICNYSLWRCKTGKKTQSLTNSGKEHTEVSKRIITTAIMTMAMAMSKAFILKLKILPRRLHTCCGLSAEASNDAAHETQIYTDPDPESRSNS